MGVISVISGENCQVPPAYNIHVKTSSKAELHRLLPSVDDLLRAEELTPLLAGEGQPAVTEEVRAALAQLRDELSTGHLAGAEQVQLPVARLEGAACRQWRPALAYCP